MSAATPFALFENRLARPGEAAGWLFEDYAGRWQGHADGLGRALAGARAEGWWAVARLDYELGRELEPGCGLTPPTAPTVHLLFFRRRRAMFSLGVDALLARRHADLPPSRRSNGLRHVHAGVSEAHYLDAVERVRDYIRAGDCYQVNLTFPLHFELEGDPLALYLALRHRQPARYGGFVQDEDGAVLSLSPELFVERSGATLVTCPMKGTAARLDDPAADRAAAEALRACPKNRAENLMIVDLLRNDLGRLARPGSVRVPELFAVEPYPSVWQMVSWIRAELADPQLPPEAILAALFPCGSITGAPKIRAMQIIDELEAAPRGLYTGSLGWFAPDGDFRLNVAIRTVEVAADGRGKMGIGSGLVIDSDPAAEWAECWLKARFLLHAPQLARNAC